MSALLALTDSPAQAVKDIASSSDEVSETGGLRLVAERAGTRANCNGGEGGRLAAVVTCLVKSSSLAWASLAPSSRSA